MVIENNLSGNEDSGQSIGSLQSEILKKYNLEENPDEAYKKIRGGNLPNKAVVNHLSKDFVNNLISEKDFVGSLEDKLKISHQTAENIVKDVIEKILPLVKKIVAEIQMREEKPKSKSVLSPKRQEGIKKPTTPEKLENLRHKQDNPRDQTTIGNQLNKKSRAKPNRFSPLFFCYLPPSPPPSLILSYSSCLSSLVISDTFFLLPPC